MFLFIYFAVSCVSFLACIKFRHKSKVVAELRTQWIIHCCSTHKLLWFYKTSNFSAYGHFYFPVDVQPTSPPLVNRTKISLSIAFWVFIIPIDAILCKFIENDTCFEWHALRSLFLLSLKLRGRISFRFCPNAIMKSNKKKLYKIKLTQLRSIISDNN